MLKFKSSMVSKACLLSSGVMDGNELVILCSTIYKALATGSYLYTVAQSICTHYFSFENMGWFVTLKKNQVQKKPGAKKAGLLLFKKRRGNLASSLFE